MHGRFYIILALPWCFFNMLVTVTLSKCHLYENQQKEKWWLVHRYSLRKQVDKRRFVDAGVVKPITSHARLCKKSYCLIFPYGRSIESQLTYEVRRVTSIKNMRDMMMCSVQLWGIEINSDFRLVVTKWPHMTFWISRILKVTWHDKGLSSWKNVSKFLFCDPIRTL